MGRAKVMLKHIQKESARRMTFTQRRKGLMKKISDFSTICGINEACLIVYDPDGNGEPAIWPQNPSRVHSILQKYEQHKDKPPKTFGLEEFFDIRKAMVEAEIAKVKKEILNIKHPTWDPCFNELTNEQLSFFTAKLTAKIEACDHRINMLKKEHQSEGAAFGSMQNMAQESVESSYASQLNSKLDISEGQLVPAPMETLNDNTVMVDSTIQVDSTNQLGDDVNWEELVLSLCDDTAMYQCDQAAATAFSSMQNIAQESVECSNPSQLNSMMKISQAKHVPAPMKSLNDNSGMVDSTIQVDVSLDSTNQLGGVSWDELGPLNWCHDSTKYHCDHMFWASQSDESILQNIPF